MAYPMVEGENPAQSLDAFIQQVEQSAKPISRGANGVAASAPSPSEAIQPQPTATSGISGTGGASLSDMGDLTPVGDPGAAATTIKPQPTGTATSPTSSLDDFITMAEADQNRVEQGSSINYLGGANGKMIDIGHSLYWLTKHALTGAATRNPQDWIDMVDQGKELKARGAFKEWLHNQTGMAVYAEPGSLAGKIGRNTPDAMMSLGTFMAAAPEMAASQGYTMTAFLKRSLGEAFMKHPWIAGVIPEVVGGVPGATIGEEIGGPAGGMAGGVVGNVVTAPFQAAARGAVSLSKGFLNKVKQGLDTLAEIAVGSPIRSSGVPTVSDDILDAYRSAEQRVRNLGDAVVEAGMENRIARKTGDLQTKYEAAHKLWTLKQEERAAAQEAERAYQRIPEAVRGKYSRETMAIRDEKADVIGPQVFAERQLEADRKMVDDAMTRALREIEPADRDLSAADYSERISQGLVQAEKMATKIEQRYWKRVDILKEQMPEREAPLKDLDRLERNMRANFDPDMIPEEQIGKLRKLFAAQGWAPGVFQALPTVKRLRGTISAIRQERRSALAADAPNYEYIANLTKLEVAANQWISEAFPDNVPLQQARAWSNTYHDLFSKSEMFPLLQKGAKGEARVREEDTLSRLFSRRHGFDDVYKVVDTLLTARRLPSIPGKKSTDAYPTALHPRQLDVVQQLADDTANGIKASFQEELAKANNDPTKLQGIMKQWGPRIEAFSKAAGEIQVGMQEALARVADRKTIEMSALQKYFGNLEPEAAIKRLWNSPNAPKLAKALMTGEAGVVTGFAKDPIAMEGFRAGLVDHLFAANQNSPGRIQQNLQDGRINRLMRVGLGADRMDRLERLVDKAVELERAPPGNGYLQGATWAARWMAVKFSALMPNFGKGGELQQAAIFSEIAKRKVTQMLTGGKNPYDLLKDAVRDPSLERLLFTKSHVDKRGMEINKMAVRRVMRMDAGLRAAYEGYMNSDEGPDHGEEVPSAKDFPTIGKQSAADREFSAQLASIGDTDVLPLSSPEMKHQREPIKDEMGRQTTEASDLHPSMTQKAGRWREEQSDAGNPFKGFAPYMRGKQDELRDYIQMKDIFDSMGGRPRIFQQPSRSRPTMPPEENDRYNGTFGRKRTI